jgi:hypothetical protein
MLAIMATPDMKAQIEKLSLIPMETRPVLELRAFVKSEIVRWGDLVTKAGIAAARKRASQPALAASLSSCRRMPHPCLHAILWLDRPRHSHRVYFWRGGRVVECTALEMRHTGNRIGGSNPSLSASLRAEHTLRIASAQSIVWLGWRLPAGKNRCRDTRTTYPIWLLRLREGASSRDHRECRLAYCPALHYLN